MKSIHPLKKLSSLLAVFLLAACSSMPSGSGGGTVTHPDPFHSYID